MPVLLRDIMNPKQKDADSRIWLKGDTNLIDIGKDTLSGIDGEYIGITDPVTGAKAGAVKTDRLIYIINQRAARPLNAMLDSIDVGVVAIDESSRIFFINEAYSKILGVAPGKILGRYMKDIEPEAALLDVLKTGKSVVLEKQLIHSVNKYVSVKMFPFLIDGRMKGAFSLFNDITELNQLNKEVRRISRVAEEYGRQIEAQDVLRQYHVIGENKEYINCIMKALTVAKTDASVLITGESGCGKEILTHVLKENSLRKSAPFITVNCSAIPESLIESELFGYEDGSFTGAKKEEVSANSSSRRAERCFSTKSAICHFKCRQNCSEFSKTER